MAQFVGIIHKDKGSDFGVCFPDFPGCITAGKTLQDAHDMAAEALQFHIDGLVEDGDPLPDRPLSLDEAARHPFAKGAKTFFLVEADLPSKAVRVNITIDENLLRRIDRLSKNRSAFLAAAAAQYLAAH